MRGAGTMKEWKSPCPAANGTQAPETLKFNELARGFIQ
jgi:hypothetical protein